MQISVIVQIWSMVLERPSNDIDLDSDFFSLGGNSLAALTMIDNVNQRLGSSLSVFSVIENGTARGIAEAVRKSVDAVYLASRDERGLINGVARLLPTTAPYLLQKVFPMLWGGFDLPHGPEIWGLSRFAAIDLGREHRFSIRRQRSTPPTFCAG